VSRRCLVAALWGLAAASALLGAGCGGSDDGSSAESQTAAAAVVSSQTYRDKLASIVLGPDDARRNFHDAPPGEQTVSSGRELVRASRAAAREIDELTPPAGLGLNGDLAEKYRRWAAALERELLRKPVSMGRLGDVVREYGKAADDVYEQILIAP
jgi:hypothetical protein